MRRVLFVSVIILFASLLLAMPVKEVKVTDPVIFLNEQLGRKFHKNISEFIINGIKVSHLTVRSNSYFDVNYLYIILKSLEFHNGRIKVVKNLKKSDMTESGLPVPFFKLPLVAPDRIGEFDIDYALPLSKNGNKEKILKYLIENYEKNAYQQVFPLKLMSFSYCMKWTNRREISEDMDFTDPVVKLIFGDLSKNKYLDELRDKFCYSEKFETLIDSAKPLFGVSLTQLIKRKGMWELSAIVIPELKLENLLPVITPGKYYLPLPVTGTAGCGEVLNIFDLKSFDGTAKDGKLKGRFNFGVSEGDADSLIDCVANNYKNSGWKEFKLKKVMEEISNYYDTMKDVLPSDMESTDSFYPSLIFEDMKDSGSDLVKNNGKTIEKLKGILGKLGGTVQKNIKLLFSKTGNGMAMITGGSMNVRLSKDKKKTFSTLMIMEVR